MDEKKRCQSCGMPLSEEFGNFGKETDGSANSEFCSFCYQNGGFVNPDQTLEEMIESSIENMTGSEVDMPLEKAIELANSFIPTLRRWKD
ncbi:MAG: transcriptional regulator [Pyrinomonadaceae bacterium]|nr:transcriptional regulator [Pyrinomonadaceae bacterium]